MTTTMPGKIRNVLFKSFIFAYVLLFLSLAVCHFFPNYVLNLIEKSYHITTNDAWLMIAHFHSHIRAFALIFFLIPALAMHCEFVSECCGRRACETEEKKEGQPN